MKHLAALSFALFAVWLLWSGYLQNAFLVVLGALSCIFVVILALRMKLVDAEGAPVEIAWRLLRYAPWLVWQVFLANLHVARRILDPKLPIHPSVIRVKPGQRCDLGRVIYANSITLTPGTVSIDIDENEITVHALTRETASDLETGEMDRRVTWLEGSA
ncbi:MAG: Na+/H+ antiporter subunit E [Planctomycetota bacterium]